MGESESHNHNSFNLQICEKKKEEQQVHEEP